jgi:CheY-like chemotaxis protein
MKTILLIDDMDGMREVMVEALAMANITAVITAQSSAEALQVLKTQEVGLISTDLLRPDEDVSAFIRRVKAEFPLIPVIVLTGDETPSAGLSVGATASFRKPNLQPWVAFLKNWAVG